MAVNTRRNRRLGLDWRRMLLAGVTAIVIGAMYLGIINTWFTPAGGGPGDGSLVAAASPVTIR